MKTTGKVTGIVSNLVTVEVNGPVSQNELCYINVGGTKLMAEVIKVNGKNAAVQVFESTRGLKNGNDVEFEYLDSIEYQGKEYIVLIPNDEEACEVVILEVEPVDEELENYIAVEDEAILEAVYAIFKDRFKDIMNFGD